MGFSLSGFNPLTLLRPLVREGGLLGDPVGTGAQIDQQRKSGDFADQGEKDYYSRGFDAQQQQKYMEDIARGRESVSAMQLKQSLGQNIAGQQAMAASARPGGGAMAARGAAMNAGRMGAGLAGQQAVAGIQERQSAQNALNELIMRQRQQELDAALGGRATAAGANKPKGESGQEKQAGAIQAGATLFGAG